MGHSELWLANTEEAPSRASDSAEDLALKCIQSWNEAVLFLTERDLRVMWMNEAAGRVLSEHGAAVTGGRIELSQRSQQAGFEQFLARADGETGSWILDLKGLGALVFRCRSIPGSSHLLLSIHNPESPSTHLPDVGALLGLTPSEARITKGLIDGRRADDLATDLSVSLETIRTHIRRIYLKVGVNSREQLIARVSAFRVP
jgi:DNA-binding CsgD family transcriptional regulator